MNAQAPSERCRRLLSNTLLFLLLSSFPLFSQVESRRKPAAELPSFSLDALSFFADTLGTRLDVYVQVPFEELNFLKTGNQFEAKYEATLSLYSSDKESVAEKNWVEAVTVNSFEETISKRASSVVVRSFYLQPAKYTLQARVREAESRKTSRITLDVEVPDFRKRALSLSDVMIVSKIVEQGDRKDILPNITANVGNSREGFHLFFEIYNKTNLDTVVLSYSIHNPKNKRIKSITRSQLEPISRGRTQVFLKVDSLQIPVGTYVMTLVVQEPVKNRTLDEVQGEVLASARRVFVSHWEGIPLSITDLDVAIEQMRYIARDSDLDHIKDALSVEEKQGRFVEYWKVRDPTPGTAQNELMEEYYGRVQYANEHFAHYLEGWKTDMGMVYIIFGTPSNVDRHPFEYNSKPYEVWNYYEENREFIFVDQTGFGDYRLITPISEVWKRR